MALRKHANEAEANWPARFTSRREAGSVLASLLADYAGRDDVLLMAIPRGGVPVAAEICRRMSLPLYVLVVEKIQAPWHEAWQQRQTIGAAGPQGISLMDTDTIAELALPEEEIKLATECAKNDQEHKEELYAIGSSSPSMHDRTVILIDDAIQTGITMKVAIQYLRKMKASQVVIAAPLCSQAAYRELCQLADHTICPAQVPEGKAVHVCYARFPAITDSAAYALLEANRRRFRGNPPAV